MRLFTLSNQTSLVIVYRNKIEIWNLQSQKCEFEVPMEGKHNLSAGTVAELDEYRLIFVSYSSKTCHLKIWDILKKKYFLLNKNFPLSAITKITNEYFVACQSNKLEIYENESGNLVQTLNFEKTIHKCLTNGVDQLIISFLDGTIEFWGGS